jgi:hypothetical protein
MMDANALIDFLKADRAALELVVKYIGQVYVISLVVREVNVIDNENELVDLGLIIIDEKTEDYYAATERIGQLSFVDRLCLFTAKRGDLT